MIVIKEKTFLEFTDDHQSFTDSLLRAHCLARFIKDSSRVNFLSSELTYRVRMNLNNSSREHAGRAKL